MRGQLLTSSQRAYPTPRHAPAPTGPASGTRAAQQYGCMAQRSALSAAAYDVIIQKCQPPESESPQLILGAQVASRRISEPPLPGLAATSALRPKLSWKARSRAARPVGVDSSLRNSAWAAALNLMVVPTWAGDAVELAVSARNAVDAAPPPTPKISAIAMKIASVRDRGGNLRLLLGGSCLPAGCARNSSSAFTAFLLDLVAESVPAGKLGQPATCPRHRSSNFLSD